MFQDDPFMPETVEQQVADLTESLHGDAMQQPTRNFRLLRGLHQIYQTQQTDPERLDQAKKRVLQHVEERISQTSKPSSLRNGTNVKILPVVHLQKKRKIWPRSLLVAVLFMGLLCVGTFFFMHTLLPSSVPKNSPVGASNQASVGLNVPIEPRPFLYQNVLYVNTGNGISAYSAQNGARERTYALPNVGDPTILNGILYTSGIFPNTMTSATRISDGKLLWQVPFGSEGYNPPSIVNGVLYGCTSDNVIYALRARDGKLLWQYSAGDQNAVNPPIVVQGIVYFRSTFQLKQSIDARIDALSATTGALLWQDTIGHASMSDLQTDGSRLYVFVDGVVEALQAGNGEVLWRTPLSFPTQSLTRQLEMNNTLLGGVNGGILYIAAGNGSIYALQTASGRILWQYQTGPGTALFGSFSVEGDAVYVGILAASISNQARASSVLALRISDGRLLWQTQVREQEIVFPTAEQGLIYVIDGPGDGQAQLIVLKAQDGTVLWQRIL